MGDKAKPQELKPQTRNKKTLVKALKVVLLVLLAVLVLYVLAFNFYDNRWGVVYDADWFANWQLDSEQFILDKMSDAKVNGVFNFNGQLPNYYPQIGLQGITFSVIDGLLGYKDNIVNYLHFANSVALAVVFMLVALWFWKEFNPVAGLAVILCAYLSHWMVASGRNLYWMLWLLFLPFLLVLFLFWNAKFENKKWFPFVLAIVVFVACFAKFACGYEYTSAVLIAMEVPIVYYAVKRKWPLKKYLFFAIVAGAASLLAFAAAFSINMAQLVGQLGGFENAKDAIMLIISQRTGAFGTELTGPFEASMEIPLITVYDSYLLGGPMPLIRSYRMSTFIYLFIGVCVLCWLDDRRFPKICANRHKLNALNVAIWVSFLGPFSWFTLAKGHSWIHRHITHILWSIPCLPLIFGVFGAWLGYFLMDATPLVWRKAKVKILRKSE